MGVISSSGRFLVGLLVLGVFQLKLGQMALVPLLVPLVLKPPYFRVVLPVLAD